MGEAGGEEDDEDLPATLAQSNAALAALQEARKRHHQAYRERELLAAQELEQLSQRQNDEALAREYAEEEEKARQMQLEADEEYSLHLAAQLNGGQDRQLQELRRISAPGGHTAVEVPLDDSDGDYAGSYHQMDEDGTAAAADGVRAPMRTGYVERLIDPAAERQFIPMLSPQAWVRGSARAVQNRRNASIARRLGNHNAVLLQDDDGVEHLLASQDSDRDERKELVLLLCCVLMFTVLVLSSFLARNWSA